MKIFIPEIIFKKIPFSKRTSANFKPTIAKSDRFLLPGYVGTLSDALIRKHIARSEQELVITGCVSFVLEDETVPAVSSPHSGSIVSSTVVKKSPLFENKNNDIVNALLDHIAELATKTGREFDLYVGQGFPIQPKDDDIVHIVVGGMAPGENSFFGATHIAEIQLGERSKRVTTTGIAKGYGSIVTDDDDHRIAQVVGSTIYMCVPFEEDYIHVLGGRGTEVFKEVLIRAWNDWMLHTQPESNILSDFTSFEKTLDEGNVKFIAQYDEAIAEIDSEIEHLQKKINRALLTRKVYVSDKTASAGLCTETATEVWNTLSGNPIVESVEWSTDGSLHLHTTSIHMESDEGTVYDLGAFVVRLVFGKEIYIWSKGSTHPKLIPHPHISAEGSVCFGNVQNELNRAIIERRTCDALELAFRWLVEGYDESLTYNKLEEWPKVTKGAQS